MLTAAFRLAQMFHRPLSELDISLNEFWYWQAFLRQEQGVESEPEQTPEDMLAFMRGLGNG